MRRPAQWARGAARTRLDEDWTLVLLGILVLAGTLALGITAAWTVHQRDAALQNAATVGSRLNSGGADQRLYQDLITMQQDEVSLFQARVDPGQAPPRHNPTADRNQVDADLATLRAQFGGSAQVQRDITLIGNEMAPYAVAEARALDDNQQGLPIGGAYLRAAAAYLTTYALADADNIREVDQSQVAADDATAGAVPWPLLAVAAIVLAGLIAAQVLLARYTRCDLDPWLLLSTAVTVVIIVWSVIALSVSAGTVSGDTSPHAREAAALAQALTGTITAGNDDALTLADHDEDCSAVNTSLDNFTVTCAFETQVLSSLAGRHLGLSKGQIPLLTELRLARADAPGGDAGVTGIDRALARVPAWAAAEQNLPTMQNLAFKAEQEGVSSGGFKRFLTMYSAPPGDVGAAVTGDFTKVRTDLQSAIGDEWASYDSGAAGASGALGGAVTGAVLLALLAAAAGGLGIGLRVAEYWSPGGQTA